MTSASLNGFLNKKEIEAAYGRSFRSLTRDITRAVKSGDQDILQHLKLVTEDEKIREGSDVTPELIQELSNSGLRPMWLAEETWVAEWCLRRSHPTGNSQQPIPEEPDPKPSGPTTKVDPQGIPDLYQLRIHDLETHNNLLVEQLKIKDDQIRAANQQAEQSQQLMRDLHVLLKNVQDGLLGEGRPLLAQPTGAQKPTRPTASRNESTDANTPRNIPEPKRVPVVAKAKPEKKHGTVQKGSGGRRTSKVPEHPVAQKRAKPVQETSVQQPSILQQWLPTFFGSKPKKK